MSKHNPNQDFYKTGGRGQTDGPDRLHAERDDDRDKLAHSEKEAKTSERAKHPAVARSKKK